MAKRKASESEDDVPKTPSDAYAGLSAITLVALLCAAVLFYVDHDSLEAGSPKPADPQIRLSEAGLNKVAPAAGAPQQ